MSPLWIVPAVVVVLGMGVLTVYVRALGTASEDLRRHLAQFGEFRLAVDELRAETAVARAGRGRR